ncbi:MAG TPA: DUF4397 domain-containing protein [Terriglobales bacterium]|nr:DUF4397 domain-containing protein [Terriglobales bacterium]
MKRLALALAAIPLLLAAGAVPASAAPTNSRVRLVYLSPDRAEGNVDLYIDGRRALAGTVFNSRTAYQGLATGQHTFDVRKAGAPAGSTPDASVSQALAAGYYSVFIGGKVGSPTCPFKAVIFSDDFPSAPAGKFAARFVHMAPEVPGVDVVLTSTNPQTVLFSNVACFQASAYSTFPTGSYPVALNATGTSNQLFSTTATDQTPGSVVTLVGAGGVDQPVQLVVIPDATAAGQEPTGGAGTGEGGSAFGGLGPLGLIASSLVGCVLLLLFARRSPA